MGAPEGLRKVFGRRVVTSVVTVVYEGFGLGPWVTGSGSHFGKWFRIAGVILTLRLSLEGIV